MPKIINKEEKKARILEASIRVFAEKGLNNTKIADIAQAADIGKGTVYEYFSSKDEIFRASYWFFIGKVNEILFEKLQNLSDPLEKLYAYFSAWVDILQGEYLEYLEIVLDFWAEGLRKNKDVMTFDLAQFYDQYRRFLADLLDECITINEIKPVDTKIAASILLGSLDGLVIQWVMDRSLFNIREAIGVLARIYIEGLKQP